MGFKVGVLRRREGERFRSISEYVKRLFFVFFSFTV